MKKSNCLTTWLRQWNRANKKICVDSAAVQCVQAREFLCCSPIMFKEEGGREVSRNCRSEL